MKKIIIRLLYSLFFSFAAVLIISCTLLVLNTSKSKEEIYNNIDAVVISGGEEASNDAYMRLEAIDLGGSEHYKEIVTHDGYDSLDTDEKQYLYEKIQDNIYTITNETDENGHYRTARLQVTGVKMSEFDIREVVNAFVYDNPQVFWFENLFGYAYSGDDTIVEFYSVLSSEECGEYIERFQKKVDEITASVDKGLSEYEREKRLHDILLQNCAYKSGVTSSSDGWTYFSAYGAIVDGEAVCEGYAKSMQILLNLVGIPCSTIRGTGDNVGHMWNVVRLGGEWYHLDATWNDNDDGTISYEYFNVTTERIEMNHVINEDIRSLLTRNGDSDGAAIKYNFCVPDCTSVKMNYYTVEGYRLESFNDESDQGMINAIVKHIKNDNLILPVSFGRQMTYTEYVNSLFHEPPFKFYYYVDNANEVLDDEHKISKESVTIQKNEENMSLHIHFKLVEND